MNDQVNQTLKVKTKGQATDPSVHHNKEHEEGRSNAVLSVRTENG